MLSFEIANLLLNRPNNRIDASIISTEQIRVLISILSSVLDKKIDGDVVEFGCYVGESSKYLRMILDYYSSNKKLYVYDSFEGLPPLSKYEENTGWRSGTLKTTEEILKQNFINNGLKPPIINKGWFKDVSSEKVPDKICFGFLDGDFYDSIKDSFSLIYPKLSKGSCVVFHDYERPDLPGVKAAAVDVINSNNLTSENHLLFKIFHELGVFIKLIE